MLTENTTRAQPPLIELHATSANGLQYGAPFSVPEHWVGLIVLNDGAADCVPAGQYLVDSATLPLMASRARLKPGEAPRKPLMLALYLLPWGMTADVAWTANPIAASGGAQLTYRLSGRCGVRVVHPAAFFNAMRETWSLMNKKMDGGARAAYAALPMPEQARQYLQFGLQLAMEGNPALSPAAYSGNPAMRGNLRDAAGMAAAQWMAGAGLECVAFELNSVSDIQPAPCVSCGASDKPVAYGIFRRTISLFIIRYITERKGNFCTPCAAKYSATDNAIMLVCGWWGYIGLVMTPIYFVQNCYHFLKIAFGPKAAAAPALSEARPGVWPPPPAP